MFTVQQIEDAHSKVKSGAEFPKYIQEIKGFGVKNFTTWVKDSHTEYFGENDFKTKSQPQYDDLEINETVDQEKFAKQLKIHQQGGTDYMQFCRDCAENGVEGWIVDLDHFTCTYFDKAGNDVLTEEIPH
ncbi:DUF1398 domain-containing protein [Chryseobacterium caseinilyticum]|uniref:DUF1398 family protein n=1 Tax=Chryseobacterium caseinilyticum TaxID=2771428 RepID=A0ABR8ZE65_9FLAO|nr:DUF1398 family protein [Chryseobacterium caseinilyticum]MBD8083143.1 DUF1398 family protein [Chryseobacterium caseinilyticum]